MVPEIMRSIAASVAVRFVVERQCTGSRSCTRTLVTGLSPQAFAMPILRRLPHGCIGQTWSPPVAVADRHFTHAG
jgi:hypothetical protein